MQCNTMYYVTMQQYHSVVHTYVYYCVVLHTIPIPTLIQPTVYRWYIYRALYIGTYIQYQYQYSYTLPHRQSILSNAPVQACIQGSHIRPYRKVSIERVFIQGFVNKGFKIKGLQWCLRSMDIQTLILICKFDLML